MAPLDFPLNDVKLSPPLPDYVEPAKTQITTLANGLKVASEASVVWSILDFFIIIIFFVCMIEVTLNYLYFGL